MFRRKLVLAATLIGALIFGLAAPSLAVPKQGNTPPKAAGVRAEVKQRTEAQAEVGSPLGEGNRVKSEMQSRVREREEQKLRQGTTGPIQPFQGKVFIGGKEFKFDDRDQPLVIREGRLLVPLRAISRGLKAEVDWDPEAKTVTVVKGDVTVILYLDKAEALVNGEKVALEIPATVINSRTLVPLRFLTKVFKNKINYDQKTGTVTIEEPSSEDSATAEESGSGQASGT